MEKRLGKSQLKAWELIVTRQSFVFGRVYRDLGKNKSVLPLHWYDVLLVLKSAPEGRMRLSDIAEHIITSRSALTRSIDKIEAASYLRKEKCKEDGRGAFAVITAKGRKAQKESWLHLQYAIQEYFGRYLNDREAEQLATLLEKVPRVIRSSES